MLTGAVVFVLVVIFLAGRPSGGVSEDPQLGEEVTTAPADHVASPAQLVIPEGRPPAGGPHFSAPQAAGVYDAPIPEGNTIHSLEHGLVWLTYHPDRLDAADVERLKELQGRHARDVILSPRPENTMSIAAVSWQRLLEQERLDVEELERFITTNRNRSPEPGVR